MVAILYYVLGGVWVYYTYYAFGDQLFKPGEIPTFAAVLEQMRVRVEWGRGGGYCLWCVYGRGRHVGLLVPLSIFHQV